MKLKAIWCDWWGRGIYNTILPHRPVTAAQEMDSRPKDIIHNIVIPSLIVCLSVNCNVPNLPATVPGIV